MNICATAITTGGLGLPAKNNLIFGMSRLCGEFQGGVHPHPTRASKSVDDNDEYDLHVRVMMGDKTTDKIFGRTGVDGDLTVKQITSINMLTHTFNVKHYGQ